ncbi:tryptophan synthase [[Candida] jaroonii]|uniref:Tryptophan synthase n=1 Tax=[Candida] jaroonii TaxID=467808 RepID=A0ACA9YBM4_9ASCO|nr:tryptophan synthase [[Candida] jaroonii]
MSSALKETFERCKKENRSALITFITAGYPTIDDTIPILQGLQKGGVDIVEIGVPFSDPIADGPTIQVANTTALENGVTVPMVLELVKKARASGVTIPLVLMGYYNPILRYGEEKLIKDSAEAGADAFIVVDLPPQEAIQFRSTCAKCGITYVPLVAPATTDARLKVLGEIADSFIYVVSRMASTGASAQVSTGIPELCARVRKYAKGSPLAVGFGVSTREHFLEVGKDAEAVVIGSKFVTLMAESEPGKRGEAAYQYARDILGESSDFTPPASYEHKIGSAREVIPVLEEEHKHNPKFGDFGGQFVPEALYTCLAELEGAFESAVADPSFWEEFKSLYSYIGRPSSLHKAERLTEHAGGAQIWLKREDLNHTGSHKINNALAQVLIAKRLGKKKIIAETGAGQHGVATATACAKFGMECLVFMGAEDVRRQALNVFRMRILGAKVMAVTNGTQTLRDATSEAFRYWVSHLDTTHYVVGSAIGPHPYPTLVRTFQSVIGSEAKEQFKELNGGKLPNAVVACVGGGSNSVGMFAPFENDKEVKMLGVEAGGDGLDTERHSATLTAGIPGVFHGVRTYVLQDHDGQVHDTHSISAGLDYPGVGPQLAYWKSSGRADFMAATDAQALIGFRLLSQLEGIIPALESSHAIYGGVELAKTMSKDEHIIINVSGRGDKDVQSVAEALPTLGEKIGWDLRFEADPTK